jgi:GntR family transcriptional regulator
MIEQNHAKPLYQALIESILAKIESGEFKSGERLPSENELCRLYQVGRNTVRHALGELVGQGVLTTVHGVGTFVTDGRLNKTAQFLFGFSKEMSLHGVEISSDVLEAKLISADAALSRRLQIQLGSEVVFLYRVRKMDGEPVAIERSYLPHELCPGILEYDFARRSLYETLSSVYNRKLDHAEQEIEASLATAEVARLLGLATPAVVLVFHRETRLANGKVIEYVDSELRADRFRFNSQLRPFAQSEPSIFRRLPIGDAAE